MLSQLQFIKSHKLLAYAGIAAIFFLFQNCSLHKLDANLASKIETSDNTPSESNEEKINPGSFPEMGGTNYTFFNGDESIDNYIRLTLANPSSQSENWNKYVKGIIQNYHLNPEFVRSELGLMYSAGQRKIGFVLWFVAPNSTLGTDFLHTVVPDINGNLSTQQKSNLINFIKDIEATGFNEVQIRFGAQGEADPLSVPAYNPNQFEQSWKLISKTRNLIESQNFKIKRVYDIGLELMGSSGIVNRSATYISNLLTEYLKTYGDSDVIVSWNSADFSGATTSLDILKKAYENSGFLRPQQISLDLYDNLHSALTSLSQALENIGWQGIPLAVQETFYNDSSIMNSFLDARNKMGLNFKYIMQWPWEKGSKIPHVSATHPVLYSNFLNRQSYEFTKATMKSSGIGCDDKQCLWFLGTNLVPHSTVEVRFVENPNLVINSYKQKDLTFKYAVNYGGSLFNSLTLRLKTQEEFNELKANGLVITIKTPDGKYSSDPVTVKFK